MASTQNTSTIEELIEAGKGVTVSYHNFSFLAKIANGTWVAVRNVINDYIDELAAVCVNVKLTPQQQYAYFYKPKLLCYDIYGNPEVYFIILLLNDMADVKEFTKPVIRMLPKSYMNTLLTYIYNAEKEALANYNNNKRREEGQ